MLIYADGSWLPQNGVGGWGYVIPGPKIERSGSVYPASPLAMELMAIVQAIKDTVPTKKNIVVYTDCKEAVRLLQTRKYNGDHKELVHEGRSLMRVSSRKVDVQFLSGHDRKDHHRRADFLANAAAWMHVLPP